MAEHTTDNREVKGSNPFLWTSSKLGAVTGTGRIHIPEGPHYFVLIDEVANRFDQTGGKRQYGGALS